jgi:hypothetical protein
MYALIVSCQRTIAATAMMPSHESLNAGADIALSASGMSSLSTLSFEGQQSKPTGLNNYGATVLLVGPATQRRKPTMRIAEAGAVFQCITGQQIIRQYSVAKPIVPNHHGLLHLMLHASYKIHAIPDLLSPLWSFPLPLR